LIFLKTTKVNKFIRQNINEANHVNPAIDIIKNLKTSGSIGFFLVIQFKNDPHKNNLQKNNFFNFFKQFHHLLQAGPEQLYQPYLKYLVVSFYL
jgi:hypothetical protein